jgi:uncharacterized DUF497 family protein
MGSEATEFEWDDGNADKNWLRHRVSQAECEQIFFNQPLVTAEDSLHSYDEFRHYALGPDRCRPSPLRGLHPQR